MLITYAVYTQKDGRWWVEKNFAANKRDAALDLANDIARTTPYLSVKVIREVHDEGSGNFNEQVILKLDATKPPPISRAQLTGGGVKRGAPAQPGNVPAKGRVRSDREEGRPVRSLGKVLLMAVPGGVLTGAALSAMILYVALRVNIPTVTDVAASPYALFTYFFLSAVSMTVFLIYKIEPDLLLAEADSYDDEPEPEPEIRVNLKKYKNKKKEEPPEEKPVEEEVPPEEAPVDAATEEEDLLPTDLSRVEAAGGMDLANLFLRSLTNAVTMGQSATRAQLYAFHIYLAGLSEEFGFAKDWDDQERRGHMFRLLEHITASRERTLNFVRSYDEHIVSPYDEALKEAGRLAARTFLAGVPGTETALAVAIKDWTNATALLDQNTTVLFTDIVGSTDFASAHGNEKALLQVRAHDQIVHAVMGHYGGQFIKHTGDGVMATFPTAADAVRAAAVMQKAAFAHTSVNAELPIRLRIGINDGRAIRENDDIFGQAVQLAARLCAAAQPEQTVVSPGVIQACEGTGLPFTSLGLRPMKGIPEPVEIFQADWAAGK